MLTPRFNKYLAAYANTPIPVVLAINADISSKIIDFLDNIKILCLFLT